MRHALHLRPLLAASTFLVVSGRRKDPLWLHKWLHSRLLALYSYVVRRLGANKPNLVADAEPAAGDAGEAGPRRRSLVCSHTHTRLTYAKMQTSLSDSTRGETPGSHAEMKLMCLELRERK